MATVLLLSQLALLGCNDSTAAAQQQVAARTADKAHALPLLLSVL
jgi:hypothetical protein